MQDDVLIVDQESFEQKKRIFVEGGARKLQVEQGSPCAF
jgi:prolyl-tRNA editing enzyme YbaK/EbsC (Cys-tRNA(Pro) deacylase)